MMTIRTHENKNRLDLGKFQCYTAVRFPSSLNADFALSAEAFITLLESSEKEKNNEKICRSTLYGQGRDA